MLTRADVILLAAGGAATAGVTAPILPSYIALHWYCASGAILGAIFVACLPGKDEPTWKQLGGRIAASVAFGVAFAPMLIRWRNWDASPEMVMGVSAGFGVFAWLFSRLISSLTIADLRAIALRLIGGRNDRD